jgi:hypothetical protein
VLLAAALPAGQDGGAAHAASHAASAASCLLCTVAHQPGAGAPSPVGAVAAPLAHRPLAEAREVAPRERPPLARQARAPPTIPLSPTA